MTVRRFFLIFIVILLVAVLSSPAMAVPPPGHFGDPPETGGILDTIIADIFNGITGVLRSADMIPLNALLYGDNVPIEQEHHRRWLFMGDWKAYAMPAYNAFGFVAYALMLITIISAGMKMGLTTWLSPSARANVAQMMFNWVVAALLLVSLPAFFNLLIELNAALVDVAFGLAGGNAPGAVPATLADGFSVRTGNLLFSSILNLALAAFFVYFNIMFMLRWFVVTALFAVSPLVIWAWAKGQSTAFFLWLGECMSNVLTQFVYALVFALVIGVTLASGDPATVTPWWMYVVIMLAIIPLGTLLRRLITQWLNIIGLDEEGTASRIMGAGVGSLVAVGGALAKGPRSGGGGSPSHGGGGAAGGMGAGGAGAGGRSGAGGGGVSAPLWQRALGTAGGVLKTTAGAAAGATVGFGLAPVLGSQGVAMGASVAGGINNLRMPQKSFGSGGRADYGGGIDHTGRTTYRGGPNGDGISGDQAGGGHTTASGGAGYGGGSNSNQTSMPSQGTQTQGTSSNQPSQRGQAGGRNTPTHGQMSIWDAWPPP